MPETRNHTIAVAHSNKKMDDLPVTASHSSPVEKGGAEQQRKNHTTEHSDTDPEESCVDSDDNIKFVGPRDIDDPVPADCLWTTKRDGAVKLRTSDNDEPADKPITIVTFVNSTVSKIPNCLAMAVKRNGKWEKWTYSRYLAEIRQAAKAFIKLGLEPYKGVGIIGFNSPEWFLANLGCIFAGGLATGIYTTNTAEACQFVAESCQANVLVVEDSMQLQKILQIRQRLPHLKAIVQYTNDDLGGQHYDPNIYSWENFMKKGGEVADSVLEERISNLAPNKCCLLIYTSGTTGTPKGVMLSHDNLTYTARSIQKAVSSNLSLKFGNLAMVSYLPLSHISAQILDIYMLIIFGGTAYFAQPDALKGSLAKTLREVHPHLFMGVPRLWEKMQDSMQQASSQTSGLQRRVAKWAKGVGKKASIAMMNRNCLPFGYGLAEKLVFRKVRAALGLDRCQIRLSGAAPITRDTLDFFLSLDLPLCEVYGMSECSGPHTVAFPKENRVGSVGKELPGFSTTLVNIDEEGNGEIVIYGRHVFMGYINEEEKTREVFDEQGGMYSGDIGKKEKDFLYITGRLKELIITAGGENVAPVAIEDCVKEALPVVSNCMLIGDKKKFLSMLITIKVEINHDTHEPTDTLSPAALQWIKSVGSKATTVTEILEPGDSKVLTAIQRGINHVNHRVTSNAQKIQKWSILPKDFSISGGELGPTMKMRRPIIMKKYHRTISAFYDEA